MGRFLNLALLFLIVNAAIGEDEVEITLESDSTKFPLPDEIYPESYEIELTIDPGNNASFSGQAKIRVHIAEETKYIILHANSTLKIEDITISDNTANDIVQSYDRVTSNTEFLAITMTKVLKAGDVCVIEVKYTGVYFEKSKQGLMHTSYGEDEKFVVWSDFYNRGVRRIFPGFDEPKFPSTVSMTIIHPEKYRAVFITPEKSTEKQEDDMVRTTFVTTKKMPINSLTLVVFEMEEVTNSKSKLYSTPVSVFAPKTDVETAKTVLNYLEKSLVKMEEYFDYKLNLPKITLVAIPGDDTFYGGRSGLIIMGSETVLVDSDETAEDEFYVAQSIAFSVAYLFTADRIDLNYWDKPAADLYDSFVDVFKSYQGLDLPDKAAVWKNTDWMEDGLATFFQHYFGDLISDSKYDYMNVFVNTLQNELNGDDSDSASILGELFINASYFERDETSDKGASIHRMMYYTIGKEQFKKAVKSYVKENQGKLIEVEEFYHELDMAAEDMKDINMSVVLNSWITNKGFPYVMTSIGSDNTQIELTQKRYTNYPDNGYPYKWWIPISWTSKSNKDFENTRPKAWLKPDSTLNLNLKDENDWFIINVQHAGYYRVSYHEDNWLNLAKALKEKNHDRIHVLNRAQLINDAYELTNDYHLDFNITAEILSYLQTETEYVPWLRAKAAFDDMFEQFPFSEKYELIETFINKMTSKIYAELGFHRKDSDSVIRRMLRGVISHLICMTNDEAYIKEAGEELSKFVEQKDYKLDGDTANSMFCCGIQKSNVAIWDKLFKKMINQEDDTKREWMLEGLACSDDLDIMNNYLQKTIAEESDLTDDDRVNIVKYSLKYEEDTAVNFLLENFEKFNKKTDGKFGVDIINTIGNEVKWKDNLKKVEEMNTKYESILSDEEKEAMTNAIDSIKNNTEWGTSKLESFEPWIENFMKNM